MKKYFLLSFLGLHVISILYTNINIISVFNEKQIVFKFPQQAASFFKNRFQLLPQNFLILLDSYVICSGVTSYCFFSPDPLAGSRLLIQKEGINEPLSTNYLEAHSQEMSNKLKTAHHFMMRIKTGEDADSLGVLFAQSIAARLFEKYPNSIKINILSPYYDLPCMGDFRKGKLPILKENNRYEFKKML
jgi:hypothetical protein